MATTSPDSIWTPDTGDDYALTVDLAATADSIQAALNSLRSTDGIRTVTSLADRNTKFPSPVQGNRVFRNDKGWIEQYFGTYNVTTNPGGATPAGWYPVAGAMPQLLIRDMGVTAVPTGAGTYTPIDLSVTPTVIMNDGFGLGTVVSFPFAGVYDVEAAWRWGTNSGGVLRSGRFESAGGATIYGRNDIRNVSGGTPGSGNIYQSLAVPVHSTTTGFRLTGSHDAGVSLNFAPDVLSVRFLRPNR